MNLSPSPHRSPRYEGLRLDGQGRKRLVVEDVHRGPIGGVADRDRAHRCSGLEPSSGIHGVPGDDPLSKLRASAERDHDLTGVDADSDRQVRSAVFVQFLDHLEYPQPCPHRAFGIVLVRRGRAEHGHDRVSDELLNRPAKGLDMLPKQFVVGADHRADVFRVHAIPQRGGADEVAEQHRDDLPLVRNRGASAPSPVPHLLQNLDPSGLSLPQSPQVSTEEAYARSPQASSRRSVPHAGGSTRQPLHEQRLELRDRTCA